jgi:hypothetical protein
MVNLGLIYKLSESINSSKNNESEAAKMFKAAVDKENEKFKFDIHSRNPAALVNLGII